MSPSPHDLAAESPARPGSGRSPAPARPREAGLPRAFLVFAAIFVAAVLGGYVASRGIATGFSEALESRGGWAERHRRIAALGALVDGLDEHALGALAASGGTSATATALAAQDRVRAAKRELDRSVDQVRVDLARVEGALSSDAIAALGVLQERARDVERQAMGLLGALAEGDAAGASRRAAALRASQEAARATLRDLDDRLHRAALDEVGRDRERTSDLVTAQISTAAILVALAALLYVYGRWLARRQSERSRWSYEAAARVAESESRLRAVLDGVVDAIVTVDGDGAIESANAAAERLFGYSEGDLAGRSIGALLAGAADEPPRRALERLVGGGAAGKRGAQGGASRREVEGRRRDGAAIPLEAGVAEIEGPLGVRYVGILRDLTERRRHMGELERAKEMAEQAAVAKARFLANMSHEIRTPLNGVVGMTGLLLDTDLDDEQRDYAVTARAAGESLLTIVNDILDFSKIEAGKLALETIDFELRTVVEEAVELLAERAQSKGLELVAIFAPDAPDVVAGDPGRLRQVLLNLVGNAIKFTSEGEVVARLSVQSQTESHVVVRFEVTDTGIGIEQASLARLFSPFTQEDASTTRRHGGTGLGLAIALELSRLMGGSCGAESEKGKGSRFWFTARLETRPSQRRPDAPRAPDLTGMRALVVDDNATARGVLVNDVAAAGAFAQATGSAEEAVRLMREASRRGEPFDAAIVDVALEGIDGITLAHDVKRDEELSGADIVLLTSFGQRGHSSQAAQAGVSAYLTKPVRRLHLRECMGIILERRRSGISPAESAVSRRFGRQISLVPRGPGGPERKKARGRVLVAEDNPVNQKVAVRTLEKLGWRADVAANGREAVDAALAIPYDIVLMDCQMPEMDGFEATAEIRRREPALGRRTPIVAVTANAMKGDRERCLEAGMDDHVAKPFVVGELRQAIERWSRRPAREPAGDVTPPSERHPISSRHPISRPPAPPPTPAADEVVAGSGSQSSAMDAPLFDTLGEAQGGVDIAPVPPAPVEPGSRRRMVGLGPPRPQPGGPAPRLDLQVIETLRALVGGPDDPDVIAELVSTFLDRLPETIAEMRAAQEGGDAGALEGHAHSLKSSARSLGAMRAGDLCQVIESEAAAGLVEGAGPRVDALEAELLAAAEGLRRVAGIPVAGSSSSSRRKPPT